MRFADCILDCARGSSTARWIIPFEPKVYEFLEALIKRRPAVVRTTSSRLLWPQVYIARTASPGWYRNCVRRWATRREAPTTFVPCIKTDMHSAPR